MITDSYTDTFVEVKFSNDNMVKALSSSSFSDTTRSGTTLSSSAYHQNQNQHYQHYQHQNHYHYQQQQHQMPLQPQLPRHLRVPYQQLVEKQQFDKVMDVLIKEHNSDTLQLWLEGKIPQRLPLSIQCSSHADNSNEAIGETPLHRLAAAKPPAWIVEALVNCMVELYRNAPLDATDVLGRTPLHVAAMNGSIDAIPVLARGTAQTCPNTETFITAPLMQDKWLRCPLHWACTHPIGGGSSGVSAKNKSRGENGKLVNDKPLFSKLLCQPRKVSIDMLEAVRILLTAYPEATIMKDCDGNTPHQLAMEHNADPSIVRLVKEIEQSVREERQCYFSTHSFWGKSHGGETTSITISESPDPAMFPDGFPGEICIQQPTAPTGKKTRKKTKSQFDYSTFEC